MRGTQCRIDKTIVNFHVLRMK